MDDLELVQQIRMGLRPQREKPNRWPLPPALTEARAAELVAEHVRRALLAQPAARPHAKDSPTSKAAAWSTNANSAQRRVYEELRREPATDDELGTRLGLGLNTVHPRRWDLVRLGLVKDTGETRPTKTGREAVVWGVVVTKVDGLPLFAGEASL